MAFAELGDVRLFFTDDGEGGPPMLFVHGYTCDSHDWSWQLAHFGATHRVIAVDLRGHGRSSVPDGGRGAGWGGGARQAAMVRAAQVEAVTLGIGATRGTVRSEAAAGLRRCEAG